MPTANARTAACPTLAASHFRLPDPPERPPDPKMINFSRLGIIGNSHYLALHFGANREQAARILAEAQTEARIRKLAKTLRQLRNQ